MEICTCLSTCRYTSLGTAAPCSMTATWHVCCMQPPQHACCKHVARMLRAGCIHVACTCMQVACTLHVRCMHVACVLHVCYMSVACALHVCCMHFEPAATYRCAQPRSHIDVRSQDHRAFLCLATEQRRCCTAGCRRRVCRSMYALQRHVIRPSGRLLTIILALSIGQTTTATKRAGNGSRSPMLERCLMIRRSKLKVRPFKNISFTIGKAA